MVSGTLAGIVAKGATLVVDAGGAECGAGSAAGAVATGGEDRCSESDGFFVSIGRGIG